MEDERPDQEAEAEASAEASAEAEPMLEAARGYLAGILERMGIAAEIATSEEDDKFILDVQCEQVERVIGRRGAVVDALQHLVAKMAYRDRSQRGKPIVVDAGNYRAKSIERLQSMAQRMAEKALESNESVELSPMSAHDRRIVHMTLAEMSGVSTQSEGSGHQRRVFVVPDPAAAAESSSEAPVVPEVVETESEPVL